MDTEIWRSLVVLLRAIFVGSEKEINIESWKVSRECLLFIICIMHIYLYEDYYADFQNHGRQKGKELLLQFSLSTSLPFSLQKVIPKKNHWASNNSIYFNPFWIPLLPFLPSTCSKIREKWQIWHGRVKMVLYWNRWN